LLVPGRMGAGTLNRAYQLTCIRAKYWEAEHVGYPSNQPRLRTAVADKKGERAW